MSEFSEAGISEYLKAERQKQGLTLKDVSERARLSVSVLQALEDGQYEQIGTPLLIRSFIRSYCMALGVDPTPLLEEHRTQIQASDRLDTSIHRYARWMQALRQRRRIGLYTVLLAVVVLVGSLYGGAWVARKKSLLIPSQDMSATGFPQPELPPDLQKNAAAPPAVNPEVRKEMPSGEPGGQGTVELGGQKVEKMEPSTGAAKPGELSSTGHSAEATASAGAASEEKPSDTTPESPPHRFEIEAEKKTWVEVRIDNVKTRHKAMLQPGEKREWEADDTLYVVVGNGGGVRMKWDGKSLDSLGKPGRVLRLRLPLAETPRKEKPGN